MQFKVNSTASNLVIGVAMVPAILLLAAAFTMFEGGRTGLGVASAAGFLGLMIGAGLLARRWSRQIEVSETGMRDVRRDGRIVEIRWDEPHELRRETAVVRQKGIAVTGNTRFALTAPDGRAIAFSAIAPAGMVGLAAKLPRARELRDGDDGIAAAVERSTATQLPLARTRIDAGERVGFGALAMSAQGLHLGAEVVPLDRVRLEPAAGRAGRPGWSVHVAGGKTAWFAARDVPNAALLAALLARSS